MYETGDYDGITLAPSDEHEAIVLLAGMGKFYLFDELVAGAERVARNLVFLGDPNQLPQVSQGAQPDEAKVSVLQHLLGEHETVPPERGIFLEHTWRLRPEICAFTSEAYYEGLCSRRR